METKADPKTIFNAWKSDIEEKYGQRRFTSQMRDEIIGILFENFLEFGIELDDAKRFAGDVEKFMVTQEGAKGKGRYKGWTDNVEKDFDTALVNYYRDNMVPGNRSIVTEDYGNHPFMPRNPVMTAWAQDRFGIAWNEKINLLVHRQGHRFCQEFQLDVLDSNWAKTGKDAPDWAKNLFNL
jgi:hypothetical protein